MSYVEVSSKSDNGKVFKNRGDDFWEKGENSREGRGNFGKKCKFHKCYPRMNLGRKFHPNLTMGVFKNRRNGFWGKGRY